MNDKWRPEGWKRPHRFVRTPSLLELAKAQDTDEVKFYQNEAFELGADAMLEALRTLKVTPHIVAGNTTVNLMGKGSWVFIPDDTP